MLPGAKWVDLPGAPTGGTYDEMAHPKAGLHTWEGLSWTSARGAFRKYPPQLAAKPPFPGVPASEVRVEQYVSLDRHGYAFAGSESDDEFIVQIELAGFAAQTHDTRIWTPTVMEWIAEHVQLPLEAVYPVPRVAVPVGFHGADEGIRPYLASKASPIRLTPAALRSFSGWLGHQHMPGDDDPNDGDSSGDQHWDPGRYQIAAQFAAAEHIGTPPHQEDDEMARDRINVCADPAAGDYAGVWFACDGKTRQWVPNEPHADRLCLDGHADAAAVLMPPAAGRPDAERYRPFDRTTLAGLLATGGHVLPFTVGPGYIRTMDPRTPADNGTVTTVDGKTRVAWRYDDRYPPLATAK